MTTETAERNSPPALEIKGGSVTLPIIRLISADMEAVSVQLRQKVKQAPEFFRSAPVMIDASALTDSIEFDLARLVGQLQELGTVPVGIRGGGKALRDKATALKLALLGNSAMPESRPQTPAPRPKTRPEVQPVRASQPRSPGSLLVDQPVRSGQRVYARGGDLIVVAPVGHGAEIMADGHIHIYGTLRGRALAGVQGDQDCRIFCHDLQAELISVAGHYRISEDLDESVQGKPVQIYLQDTALIIEAL